MLVGFMYLLVRGVNNTVWAGLAGVHERIDSVRADVDRLYENHNRLNEGLRAAVA